MTKFEIRSCKRCLREFEATKATKIFCTRVCALEFYALDRIPLICFRCDKEYVTNRERVRRWEKQGKASVCPTCAMSTAAKEKNNSQGGWHKKVKKIESDKIDTSKLKKWCHNCQYGKQDSNADLGWSCQSRADICKPWAGTVLWLAK